MAGPQTLRFNRLAVAIGVGTFVVLAFLYALAVNWILVRWSDPFSPGAAADLLAVGVLVVGPYALYAIPGVVIGRVARAAPFAHGAVLGVVIGILVSLFQWISVSGAGSSIMPSFSVRDATPDIVATLYVGFFAACVCACGAWVGASLQGKHAP